MIGLVAKDLIVFKKIYSAVLQVPSAKCAIHCEAEQ